MGHYRVIISGAYGEGNFGDDVLMVACHGLLSRLFAPGEIAIHFTSRTAGHYARKLIPGINIVRYEALEASSDLIVWGGGTQFYSFPNTKTSSFAKIRSLCGNPKKLANSLVKKWNAKIRRAHPKIIALGLGLGPFVPGSLEESHTQKLLRGLDRIVVRDPASLSLCREWGFNEALLRSDLCFLPGIWWSEQLDRPSVPSGRRVGVIVRDWPHDEASSYDQALFNAAVSLRANGFDVQFISFRPAGDLKLTAFLSQRGEKILGWEPDSQTIPAFLRDLAGFDCFISARYHGALFAALLGKPVVCIELEPKLRMVADLLSNPLWKKPFEETQCVAFVRRIFDGYGGYVSNLADAVDSQRLLALTMQSEFLARVQSLIGGARDAAACASPACEKASS